MNREKNLMKYGFASILLLASFLMTVPANQYQMIFAQTEGEESEDNQQNVTEVEAEENVTDVEIPEFENGTAAFVPPPEGDREAPPIPADAIKGADIPDEQPPEDTDSQPLSVSNRTELLEVLPANSTKIIEKVDEDLKNSTGEGLLPPAILDKIKSGEGQGNNNTILDISTPEELDEIKNFSDSTTNQTSEEAVEEGEPLSNITNATGTEAEDGEEQQQQQQQELPGEATNVTNATGAGGEEQQDQEEAEDGEEQQQQQQELAGEATNVTNATGAVETNITSAPGAGGEEQQDQEEAEDGEEQQQQQQELAEEEQQDQEEEAEDGEEQQQQQELAITNATNATVPLPPEGMLNTTNVTSMLNATGLEDQTEDSDESPEEEPEDE